MKIKKFNILFQNVEWPKHHEQHENNEHKTLHKKPEEFVHEHHQKTEKIHSKIQHSWRKIEHKFWDDPKKVETKVWEKVKKEIPHTKEDPENKPPVHIETPELSQLKLKLKEIKNGKEAKEWIDAFKRWILKEHLSTEELWPEFSEYTQKLYKENNGKPLSKEQMEKAKEEFISQMSDEKLNKIYEQRMWKLVIDKDGKKIPTEKYEKILKEVKVLQEVEKTNPSLAKDALALYWEWEIKAASEYLAQLKKDGKFPKNIAEFDDAMRQFQENAKKQGIDNPAWYQKQIKKLVESGQMTPSQASEALKSLTPAEARNVNPVDLPKNFDSLEWKEKTLALIKKFEWFSEKSFWDYKQYTRWYGTKAPGANQTISEQKASNELSEKVDSEYNLAKFLDKQTMDWLGDNQKAALTSFIFNLWPWKLKSFKPLLKEYASAEWEQKKQVAQQIANKMQNYCHAGWKVLEWLVARRKTEAELFLKENNKNTQQENNKKVA